MKDFPPRRIMIVDDDPFVRRVLEGVLESFGPSEIRHAKSGEEAVAMAADFQPDLVLLDLVLPAMDGRATLAALKSREPAPVIVMLTAAGDADRSQLMAAGAKGVIAKPFDPSKVGSRIRDIVVQG